MVIDSLAEMVVAARESERFPAFARTLLASLRAAEVSVMITSETSSLGPTTETVGGLSFLYHNVVLLRYIEQGSEVGRAVAILKMRDSDHEKGLRTFEIGHHGFDVKAKLEGVTGLLGWSALRGQNQRIRSTSPTVRFGRRTVKPQVATRRSFEACFGATIRSSERAVGSSPSTGRDGRTLIGAMPSNLDVTPVCAGC